MRAAAPDDYKEDESFVPTLTMEPVIELHYTHGTTGCVPPETEENDE